MGAIRASCMFHSSQTSVSSWSTAGRRHHTCWVLQRGQTNARVLVSSCPRNICALAATVDGSKVVLPFQSSTHLVESSLLLTFLHIIGVVLQQRKRDGLGLVLGGLKHKFKITNDNVRSVLCGSSNVAQATHACPRISMSLHVMRVLYMHVLGRSLV